MAVPPGNVAEEQKPSGQRIRFFLFQPTPGGGQNDFAISILQHGTLEMRRVAISGSAGGFDLPGRGERDFAAITAGAPLNPAGHRVKVTTRRSHNSPAILSSPERLRTPAGARRDSGSP
jgi:hypothetical protein